MEISNLHRNVAFILEYLTVSNTASASNPMCKRPDPSDFLFLESNHTASSPVVTPAPICTYFLSPMLNGVIFLNFSEVR